jgi:hypothetical protein
MSEAQGWEAIQAALARLYGGQEPSHYGTVMRYSEGGPDPLDGISAYRAGPPDHWHFITFGFSELYGKTGRDPAVSGWGFELSFRLARPAGEESPPPWALVFLQHLARYVFNTRCPFDHEHYIRWGGPITKAVHTRLEGLVFFTDPALGTLATPNGTVRFLVAFGITADEHRFAAENGPEALLPLLLTDNPLGVVRMDRRSVLAGAGGPPGRAEGGG